MTSLFSFNAPPHTRRFSPGHVTAIKDDPKLPIQHTHARKQPIVPVPSPPSHQTKTNPRPNPQWRRRQRCLGSSSPRCNPIGDRPAVAHPLIVSTGKPPQRPPDQARRRPEGSPLGGLTSSVVRGTLALRPVDCHPTLKRGTDWTLTTCRSSRG